MYDAVNAGLEACLLHFSERILPFLGVEMMGFSAETCLVCGSYSKPKPHCL